VHAPAAAGSVLELGGGVHPSIVFVFSFVRKVFAFVFVVAFRQAAKR
jgi:hypothetical protein